MTVALNTAPATLTNYMPQPPEPSDESEPVDELVKVHCATFTDLRYMQNLTNRLFKTARRRQQTRSTTRVFMQWRGDGSETLYRSEVENGRAYAVGKLGRDLQLAIRRTPWWEGPETSIQISNGNGSSASGLLINNHTSGAASSYFTVPGVLVDGDTECKCRLELTNTAAVDLMDIYVGVMKGSTAWTTAAFLQGESAITGGSNQSDAFSSNGQYRQVTFSGTSATLIIGWTIGDSLLSLINSRSAVPIVRFSTTPPGTDIQIRWALFYGVAPVFRTDWQTLNPFSQLHAGLPIPLPPRPSGGAFADHTLYIEARRGNGAATTLNIDFVQLFPTDCFRRYTPASYYIPQNWRVVDDSIDDLLYTQAGAGGARATNYVAYGEPLSLNPGENATFCILTVSNTGTMSISQTLSAKLVLRPRRMTI